MALCVYKLRGDLFLVMGYSSLCSVMLHALLACADSLLWFVKYGSDKQYRDL